jgi:hypothetical protein
LRPIVLPQQNCDGHHENEPFAHEFRAILQGLFRFEWFDGLDTITRRPNGHSTRHPVIGLANGDQQIFGGVKAGEIMFDAFRQGLGQGLDQEGLSMWEESGVGHL